jgi:predicted RNase H-like HicB family nuclease
MPVQEDIQRKDVEADAPVAQGSPLPRPVLTLFGVMRKIFNRAEDQREVVHEDDPPTTSHVGTWNVEIRIEEDPLDGGYIAECANLPGAMSQGETKQEAFENLIDAVQEIIAIKMTQHCAEHGLDIAHLDGATNKPV